LAFIAFTDTRASEYQAVY